MMLRPDEISGIASGRIDRDKEQARIFNTLVSYASLVDRIARSEPDANIVLEDDVIRCRYCGGVRKTSFGPDEVTHWYEHKSGCFYVAARQLRGLE